MREILFRGKCKDNGEWAYGSVVHQTDYYGKKVDRYFIIDGTSTQDYDIGYNYEVIPETVGQYTDLTDKNGKMIFEGDVVKYRDKCGYIVFDGCEFCVKFKNIPYIQHGLTVPIWANYFEVVGNRWDNPSLLQNV